MELEPLLHAMLRSADFDLISHAQFHQEPFLPPNHRHANLYQLSYMLRGYSVVRVAGRDHVLRPGDVMFVPPGQWHGSPPHAADEPAELMQIKFSLARHPAWRLPTVITVDSRMDYESTFQNMIFEFHLLRPMRVLLLRTYLIQLALILFRSVGSARRAHSRSPARHLSSQDELKVKTAMGWIRQHYRERITLAQIATTIGLSVSGLSHSFKKVTGYSPIHYLVNYRLSQALGLMERSGDKLDVIAEAVGFTDAGYFSRMFKKRFKQAPRHYVRTLNKAK